MFVDDTLIHVFGKSSTELERKMNIAFNIVEQWMNINKLKLNAGKTKCMIVKSVRKEQRGTISIRGTISC
jgi:hypothetical protein